MDNDQWVTVAEVRAIVHDEVAVINRETVAETIRQFGKLLAASALAAEVELGY